MEVQTPKKPRAKAGTLNPQMRRALASFDTQPDSALVPVQVPAALMSVTTPTIWKWASAGKFPKPVRHGSMTRWRVGDIRQTLAAMK
jgi:predicted DNA-binding transcriptional regulator AlpA